MTEKVLLALNKLPGRRTNLQLAEMVAEEATDMSPDERFQFLAAIAIGTAQGTDLWSDVRARLKEIGSVAKPLLLIVGFALAASACTPAKSTIRTIEMQTAPDGTQCYVITQNDEPRGLSCK